MAKQKKTKRKRYLKSAGRAANWIRDMAASKVTPQKLERHRARKLGTFGPASEVRHIDPSEWKPT